MTPRLDLDEVADVLYVRLPNRELYSSREAPSDSFLVLNTDQDGNVVGIQVLYATDLAEHWSGHPDRNLLPTELIRAIDEWVASRH